jgi:hypothetical protein
MLRGSSCSGHGDYPLLRHGHITLPALGVDLTYRVIPTEQDKSVSLPQGKAHRKMGRWRCGHERKEEANAAL